MKRAAWAALGMDSEGDETKAVRVEGGVSGSRPITFRCLRHDPLGSYRKVCAERSEIGTRRRDRIFETPPPTTGRPFKRPESRLPKAGD